MSVGCTHGLHGTAGHDERPRLLHDVSEVLGRVEQQELEAAAAYHV